MEYRRPAVLATYSANDIFAEAETASMIGAVSGGNPGPAFTGSSGNGGGFPYAFLPFAGIAAYGVDARILDP